MFKSEDFVEKFYQIYRLNYTIIRFGSLYGTRADNSNGVYIEATYKASDKISFTAGYLTASQWLSFYEAGGITTLGVNGHRKLNVLKRELPLKASLIFNPNYKSASPLVGNNPAYFVLSTKF